MAATILTGVNAIAHSAISMASQLAKLDQDKNPYEDDIEEAEAKQDGLTEELHGTAVANNIIGGVNEIAANVLNMVTGLTKLDEQIDGRPLYLVY